MKAKNQRLTLILVAVAAMIGAALLAMSALKDEAAYFYSPADLAAARPSADQALRLGGMVADKSIKREADGVTITFMVTDGKAQTPVRFKGIAPDLFKENSGVVAEGKLGADGVFVADNILAKHDERYMPPQMDGKMHKTGKVE
ncbi:MAG: cytochrome c maturation protein CcmE [Sphingomonadales bacterium]|jgi:cytochrome c-type biogenesis protein CcmE|nr:cytochrome c maturation protein CcmE [Sphingomonadales bacterium]